MPSGYFADRGVPAEEKRAQLLALIAKGVPLKPALAEVRRDIQTYKKWRRDYPEFAAQVDRLRRVRSDGPEAGPVLGSFAEFSEKYLHARVFPHMQNVVDLIEGRDPGWTHPSMVLDRGEPDLVIVNMPPEHPAVLSTPVFTSNRGWVTLGDVTGDDWIVDPAGLPCPVVDSWESSEPVPVFDVVFDTGDRVRTSAEHLWNVYPVRAGARDRGTVRQVPTAQLGRSKFRVPVAEAWDGPDQVLPVDPYLFGYWLGDGCHSKSEFAVGDMDLAYFTGQLDVLGESYRVGRDSRGRSNVVYVHGLRSRLKATGMFGDIDRGIPVDYFRGSFKQRLALLQGLMDADGTITVKDSRARFVQHKERLARDVYRLVASLGLRPHVKQYGDAWEVGFRTKHDPVFRLPRKADRQKPWKGTSKSAHRVIVDVVPAGVEKVKCISVLTDTNEYLIGDGMIPTRNGKSTVLTMNYVTYRINQNPKIRVLIVSKTQQMASKFLYGIKTRLTHRSYGEMHAAFGPPGGWDKDAESWSQTRIYVNQSEETDGEKDPTVEALGIRGHIYGARADLIIMDDCVDLTNAHEYEKQLDWIQSEVMSRITTSGALVMVGTRLAPKDLYSEARRPERYPDEQSPWTYLAMPALLEPADKPEDWVTLWPRSDRPEIGAKGDMAEAGPDGLYPKWDGKRLYKKRGRMQPGLWSLVYQQQGIAADAVFPAEAVAGVINGQRLTGVIPRGMAGQRSDGMDGLIVVAGLDPAMAGHTAAVVIGLDIATQRRYVLDVHNQAKMTPDQIRELIAGWTARYGITEWRIEKNAFQSMLTQDREVRETLAQHGAVLREHFTGANKWDTDFGVASMTTLFYGWQDKRALIEFPSTQRAEGVKAMVEQLVTWSPDAPKTQKTDVVMALWFAELACRDRILSATTFGKHHIKNPFATRWDRKQQRTVSLVQAEADGLWQPLVGG